MKIIDAHLHFFSQTDPAEFDAALDAGQVSAAVVMGAGHDGPGPAVPPVVPPRIAYCCGLRSGGVTPENRAALLRAFDAEFRRPACVGMKLYCGYELYYPHDPVHAPFIELLLRHNLTLVVHSGDTAGGGGLLKYAHPLEIDLLARAYPELRIVIAHCGNPWIVDAVAVAAKNKNVYLDLSGLAAGEVTPAEFASRYRGYLDHLRTWLDYLSDWDKVLFGSDWPLTSIGPYAAVLAELLPPESRERVFYANALRVFRLAERGII